MRGYCIRTEGNLDCYIWQLERMEEADSDRVDRIICLGEIRTVNELHVTIK